MTQPLTPLVDFARTFLLEEYSTAAGAYVPVTTGTITCYLAATNDAATAVDPALTGSATYIGGNGAAPAGTWFFGIDAAVLTFALLDGLFLDASGNARTPYLIVLKPSGTRVAEKLKYVRVQKAVLA